MEPKNSKVQKEPSNIKNIEDTKILNIDESETISTKYPDGLIDLGKVSLKNIITNTDIILSILEICTYNIKYNYDCSNKAKEFWERVVKQSTLKNIFKNIKAETLRKYWQIIRRSKNTLKFLEIVKNNQSFINNNNFKIMSLLNGIVVYILNNETDFESFFEQFNCKNNKDLNQNEESQKSPINLISKKRATSKNITKKKEAKTDE